MKERRNSPRISISLPVQFQTEDGTVHQGTVENLSEGGMLLVTNDTIREQTNVRILFGEYEAGHAIELQGSVVRSSEVGEFGISFVEVSERALDAIRKAMFKEF